MKNTARIFKALADETRLRILALLLTEEELSVTELVKALHLPQSTVSRHLAYLKNVGWLDDRRSGVTVRYAIREDEHGFQNGMAYFLRRHLSQLPTHAADRVRLAGRRQEPE